MKTVLVLDDEETVLKVIGIYLRRSGYDVAQARTPADASEYFTSVNGAVDLLVADVHLETGNGIELAVGLQGRNPGLKLILMSGYSLVSWREDDTSLLQELVGASWRIIEKPFAGADLLSVVRELIDIPMALKAFQKAN